MAGSVADPSQQGAAASAPASAATPASAPAPARTSVTAPGGTGSSQATHSGQAGQVDVVPPRLDQGVEIDGHLDEPAWAAAASLTDFSTYAPVDGAPSPTRTEVLVWYSPAAIYFGVRAEAPPGGVKATLADRDRLDTDDHVSFFLGTFDDGRQALVFAVNPLGAQADGTLVEGTSRPTGEFGGLPTGREPVDLSPDFVFQSRGRLTPAGYEVEIRIPFKSLRYQSAATQTWGLHVVRTMPGEGREDSWAPARRAGASFLAQSGRLRNLTGLRRGLVLDLNPFATAHAEGGREPAVGGAIGPGAAASANSAWNYDVNAPETGINLRWGVTENLTLNGTVNPDFSQVESDVGQLQYDPRLAVYYPEKRPFFLDGIEQFATPNNLIYTRRIVAPDFASKFTGRVGGSTSLAVLSALDDDALSATGEDRPLFTIARVQRDVGEQSKLGAVFTQRLAGDDSNVVGGVDTRLVFGDIYALQAQGAVSRTSDGETTTVAPLWQVLATRSGRRYAFRYSVRGVDPGFRAAAGFISRAGIAQVLVINQALFYGAPGARLEKWTADVSLDGTWQYDDFTAGRGAQDRKLHLNANATVRGGWQAGASLLIETFGYDEDLYADYALLDTSSGTPVIRPFVGTPRLPNLDGVLSFSTPQRRGLSAEAMVIWGKDENFFEWASANIFIGEAALVWRPTERLRVDARNSWQTYQRRTDLSYVGRRTIPRVKVEYQLTRSIFLRVVGDLDHTFQDDLRDDSRTNLPIVIWNGETEQYERALRQEDERLRVDALFSYQPTPGTVVFVGYGSTAAEPNDLRAPSLRRVEDGFFVKVSYLFRL
jgi:hypothetical protein